MLTLFLDLDGPLLDGKLKHYNCYREILSHYGGRQLPIDDYWEMKRTKVTRDIMLERSQFQASYELFLFEWINLIETEAFLQYDVLQDLVLETLALWQEKQYRIILVTMRKNRENLLQQLESFGISKYLDEILNCPFLQKNTKYQALKNHRFKKAVFIGDTEEDTSTAKLLGIPSIGITSGLRNAAFLQADYLVDGIHAINFDTLDYL